MATFTKIQLSASTDGKPIQVTAAAGATTLHTATAVAGQLDEVWIWAQMTTGLGGVGNVILILYDGVQTVSYRVPTALDDAGEPRLLVPGIPVSNGVVVAGRSIGASTISFFHGYVNRITP